MIEELTNEKFEAWNRLGCDEYLERFKNGF